MIRAFDIETIPNEVMVECLPEPEVAYGNTNDPEKRGVKLKRAKEKQVERMALNPLYGRICSISFYDRSTQKYKVMKEISDAEEINLINYAFEMINPFSENGFIGTTIVTHNGMEFDFPYLYKRAALLRVELPPALPGLSYWLKRYTYEPHCDMMMAMSGWKVDHKGNNLDNLGKCFLGRGKTERDYSTYIDLIKDGKADLIGQDNLCDTGLTYDLYNRLESYLF